MIQSTEVKAHRAKLWQNGFRPIEVYSHDAVHWSGKPIEKRGKAPKGDAWQKRAKLNPPEATQVEPTVDALNTGILCDDGLIAIDIDVDDPAIVSNLIGAAWQHLGCAPMRTRPDSARVLLPYRIEGDGNTRITKGTLGQIEEIRGKQFVAFGIHPDGAPYEWPQGSPSDFHRDSLTLVTQEALDAFVYAVSSLIGAEAPAVRPVAATGVPVAPVASQVTDRMRAFAEAALADEIAKLSAMREGEGRNAALNQAAHSLATMDGWIDINIVANELFQASIVNGYVAKDGERAAKQTIESGINAGRLKPRAPLLEIEVPQYIRESVANLLAHEQKQNAAAIRQTSKRSVTLMPFSEIEEKPVEWLWNGYIPLGKLTLLAGAGGTGKSTIAFSLAGTITNGGLWPDGTRCAAVGNVVIWSSEDDPADTIKPRLLAVSADVRRCGVITGATDAQGIGYPFDPANDMAALRGAVSQIGGISLLIIDPIVSAVTGDMNKANDVRRSLQTIVDFAAEMNCAVLGITHFAKGTAGKNSAERVIGSTAFKDFSRMTLVAAKDEESDNRVFTRAKSNNSADTGGFSYSIDVVALHRGIVTTCVKWGEPLQGSSRSILAKVEGDERQEGDKLKAAKQFLIETLTNGPVASKEVLKHAREGYGITEDTLRRAYKDIGAKPTRIGFGSNGAWMWALPIANPSHLDR